MTFCRSRSRTLWHRRTGHLRPGLPSAGAEPPARAASRPHARPLVDFDYEDRAMSKAEKDTLVRYRGEEYKVVLGPPCFVEQRNGALMGSGMPTISLADPGTDSLRYGLTVEIPEAPLKPGQVLVGGRAEGLRALIEGGVVRHTGDYYRSKRFDATFAVCDLLIGPHQCAGVRPRLLAARAEPIPFTRTASRAGVRLVGEDSSSWRIGHGTERAEQQAAGTQVLGG